MKDNGEHTIEERGFEAVLFHQGFPISKGPRHTLSLACNLRSGDLLSILLLVDPKPPQTVADNTASHEPNNDPFKETINVCGLISRLISPKREKQNFLLGYESRSFS